jgi:hypothetical protein
VLKDIVSICTITLVFYASQDIIYCWQSARIQTCFCRWALGRSCHATANAQHIHRQRLRHLAPLCCMVLGYEARYTEVEGGVNLNVASWLCGVNLIEKSSWTYEADLGAGP